MAVLPAVAFLGFVVNRDGTGGRRSAGAADGVVLAALALPQWALHGDRGGGDHR